MAERRYRNESGIVQLVQVNGDYVRVAPGETIVADSKSQVPSVQGFVLVNEVQAKSEVKKEVEEAKKELENQKTGLAGDSNDTPVEAQRTSRRR